MQAKAKTFVRVTALFASLGALGFTPVHAFDLVDEDVPEIAQQGPAGQPVHPVIRDGEGPRHIDQAGPEGKPAPVVIWDGEGDPDIDRLGPQNRETEPRNIAGFGSGPDGS